ncbi:NPCBM/NEW2 domain-containing protein [Candidatus Poribacteria bacterium]|nr:NPCBM/NEW2 domain-containing protein [Candidatus Poribacteria bacterium]
MKRFRFLLTLFLILVALSANANYLVKTIYIKPNNVQNVPFDKIRGWMNDVQELYMDEMSRNGFGDKIFKYERENNENIKVNVINTNRPSHIYQSNTWDNINSELPENFKDQKNVHVFIVGGIDTINLHRGCCQWGVGWPIYNSNFGGSCIVAENANTSMARLIAHEIGHTFSLYHTGTANTIMGSGKELLEYEARWLDKHYFFNLDRIIKWQHPKVNQVLNVEEIEKDIISIKIDITSPNDLYQIVVMDSDILVIGWQNIDGKNTNVDMRIGRSKLIGKNHLTFMIMDTLGAFTHHRYDFTMPPRFKEEIVDKQTNHRNKNEDLGLEEDLEPITIKEDTSKDVVYLNINSGKKTLPDEVGLKPFNPSAEFKNGWGWQTISDNRTNNGNPIIIRNATFERGISLSPPDHPKVSSLKYNLVGNNYIAFEGYIGITNDRDFEIDKHQNESCFVGGSCIFTFEIDQKKMYESDLLTGKDNYEKISFFIPFDAIVLRIVIDSGLDTSWCDHPAIGDPKLITNSQIRYSIKPEDKVTTLWGELKRI